VFREVAEYLRWVLFLVMMEGVDVTFVVLEHPWENGILGHVIEGSPTELVDQQQELHVRHLVFFPIQKVASCLERVNWVSYDVAVEHLAILLLDLVNQLEETIGLFKSGQVESFVLLIDGKDVHCDVQVTELLLEQLFNFVPLVNNSSLLQYVVFAVRVGEVFGGLLAI